MSIRGRAAGDLSSLIQSLTLDASGHAITVNLSAPLPDGDVFTLSLADVLRTPAGKPLPDSGAVAVTVLAGDVDGSGEVTAADMLAIRARAGSPLTAATCGFDVDDSGGITAEDMRAVRTRIGRKVPD
ncbi:MAG: hypothetical protein JXL80_06665 [Planctomycetes bacterium]|nr:hypothetical protein [Planctomycetota bacterium]